METTTVSETLQPRARGNGRRAESGNGQQSVAPIQATAFAVCVSSPSAARYAKAAADLLGVTSRKVAVDDLITGRLPECELLLYDAVPYGSAEETLRRLRTARPGLPVLLFLPPRPGLVPLVLALGRIPGVAGCAQWGDGQDPDRLAELICVQCRTAPEQMVARVLDELLDGSPDLLTRFARMALHARASAQHCSVASLAEQLGMSPRTLQRHWPGDPHPMPKALLDSVTLLFATYTREWSESGWCAVARAAGMNEHTLRRVRARHLNGAGTTDVSNFDAAVTAFTKSCGIPPARAVSAIHGIRRNSRGLTELLEDGA